MRPHPRIRKTVKWGGAAGSVLLAVTWIGSRWAWAGWATPRGYFVSVLQGRLIVGWRQEGFWLIRHGDTASVYGWHGGALDAGAVRLFWWFYFLAGGDGELAIPLWALAAGALLVAAAAWRLDILAWRRARVGLCPKCNYDRAGLAAGAVCPECGAAGSALA